ncbi:MULTISPECIES: pantoate--beta-alanine ligase [Inquilinus]|uniref:Pantothenate synthetase n=1 Tax=Inquilinus ginsengisoli TaxID=363840 RepID=A0ABU1JU92_9PROT|nr:pantoate--beta-alanine ligase [Inquilinus ginsengisoli]MDR6292176.1 pantoate--beta-alanine ligase [Inquilinus ginsengisoli]
MSPAAPALPLVARTAAELRTVVAGWRRDGARIGLVPTMGALHQGHLTLAEAARRAGADRILFSIFVNPAQFGPKEDFSRYPRREAEDLAKLAGIGADLAYLPTVEEIYPPGFAFSIVPGGPIVADLEAAIRPGHFAGVATVVAKLLIQAGADIAAFGEKDYQQLLLVRRLVRDLDLPCAILAVPTVRDGDGLALSSRNAFLTEAQLAVARRLNRILAEIAAEPGRLAAGPDRLRDAGFDAVDYLVLRDAETLADPVPGRPRRLIAAVRLGATRLLDNLPVA